MSGMFGSGTQSLPTLDQRPLGLQVQKANTNQQARPVPLVYGQQRISITFISELFDISAIAVDEGSGKQSTQVGTNYYASFAGLIGMGPVDGLYDLFLNGEPVFAQSTALYAVSLQATGNTSNLFMTATFQTANPHGLSVLDIIVVLGADQPEFNGEFTITAIPSSTQFQYQIVPTDVTYATDNQSGYISAQVRLNPVLRDEDNPDFADITIPDYGILRIYWGTETQPQDTYLNTVSGNVHPAYLGQCYIVFRQLWFGFNQTNVPNVEVVVARAPLPTWASEETGQIGDSNNPDANPAYIIGDMFQNPRSGLALSDEDIDTDGLDDAAVLYAESEFLGVSQAISRQQDLRTMLKTLCETIDALVLVNAAGQLSILPIRPVAEPVGPLTDGQLSDLPSFTPADWSTVYTDTKLIFPDRALAFMDNLAEWRDIGVRNVVTNPDALAVDRRWIARNDLATAMAQAAGQAASIPLISGKIKLRYDDTLYAQLAVGAVFTVDFSLRLASNLQFRVMARTVEKPDEPEFQIDFQADRTYLYSTLIALQEANNIGSEESEPPPDPTPPLLGISANTRLRLIELPPGLCAGAPAIAAVVARNSTAMTGFSLWLDKLFAWTGVAPDSFALLQNQTRFAFHGFTLADYPSTTRLIDLELGVLVQLDGPDQSIAPITAFDALADSMLAFIDDEILSLAGWTVVGSGVYRLQFIRGRFGTPIEDHEAGAKLLMIGSANLAVVSHPSFKPDNMATLKVALGNQDISQGTELQLTLTGTAWRVPPPCALSVNGRNVNAVFPGGATPLTVSWVLPDPGGILPRFDLVKLCTRLQFFVASDLIYQTDVAWPATSVEFVFETLNGGHDANFCVAALTVCDINWKQIPSFAPAKLNVIKYP